MIIHEGTVTVYISPLSDEQETDNKRGINKMVQTAFSEIVKERLKIILTTQSGSIKVVIKTKTMGVSKRVI